MTSWRKESLQAIRRRPDVSVLILGGGVNGVGLFRELALQGVDCLLVDKADFASGASSKSSRMIHGGLRYLENGEFGLVRESLLERNLLLENAAHTVAPLRTTIPIFSWLGGLLRSPLIFLGFPVKPGVRGALIVKTGLSFYDFFTRKCRRTPTHFFSSRAATLREVPGLNPDIVASATYWDACIRQAERLCVEMVLEAPVSNAACRALNYVSLLGVEGPDVLLKDQPIGERFLVRPRVVVNATGAWVDITNRALGLSTRHIGGTKGSHLVVESQELSSAIGDRMVYYQDAGGRVCIVFTFLGKVILGSTDIRVEDPDTARCDETEIEYMLSTLRIVFPSVRISRRDIVFKFCGVRPLPAARDEVPGKISRDHSVVVTEPEATRPFPVLCLIGGKWTTFRAFSEQTADRILARLGRRRQMSSRQVPIGGGKGFPASEPVKAQWIERIAEQSRLTKERVGALVGRYGTRTEKYVATLSGRPEAPLRSLPDYTAEEIAWIAAEEHVEHLADIACRRSLIALLGQARREVLEELAVVAGEVLEWDPGRRQEEVERALTEVAV